MLDDFLNFSEDDIAEIKNPQANSSTGYQPQQQNQYQGNGGYQQNQNNGGNNYQQNQGNNNYQGHNNKQGFKRKEEVVEEPYIPVTIFVDRDFPQEIKDKLCRITSKLINAGITVRYNADDKDIHSAMSGMSQQKIEAYVPWKNFNDIQSKFYWNTKTSDHIAETNFQGWEKIPKAVKAMMSRNVRMLFGDKNNSITGMLITWSPDGITKSSEVTRDTGRASFLIKLASQYRFPIVNIGKEGSEQLLEKFFNLS